MKTLAQEIHRIGVYRWDELERRERNILVALWIYENRREMDDILFDMNPERGMADDAIARLTGSEHMRMQAIQWTIARIDSAIESRARKTIEKEMRHQKDWLEYTKPRRVPGEMEYQEE